MFLLRKFLLVFLSNPYVVFGMQHAETEIVISFDVNKTIIASDLCQGKNVEQMINAILAEFTYADWDSSGKMQSYYTFLTEQLAAKHPTIPQTDEAFKVMRDTHLKEFPFYLASHQNPQLRAEYEHERRRMMDVLAGKEFTLFPSFLKVIKWLSEKHHDRYTLYLRTFGDDLPKIMPLIEQEAGIVFAGTGEFKDSHLFLNAHRAVSTAFLLYPHHQHYGIQDDYQSWKKTGFQARGGKPFIIDRDNPTTVYLFFDDNADDRKKPILCPINERGVMQDTAELLTMGHIVAVNPKAAILDEDYFIRKIEQILSTRRKIA